MRQLKTADLRTLLDVVGRLYAAEEPGQLGKMVASEAARLVPCDLVSYNEVDVAAGTVDAVSFPEDPGLPLKAAAEMLARHQDQHPLVTHYARTGDGSARTISDFLTRGELHRLDVYEKVLRPLHTEHQLAIALPGPVMVGLAWNRERADFEERDRAVANLLRPHLAQAHAVASARMRMESTLGTLAGALDAQRFGVLIIGEKAAATFANPRAEQLLNAYLGTPLGSDGSLPSLLHGWVAEQRRHMRESGLAHPPLLLETPRGRLTVRLLAGHGGGNPDALVLEEERLRGGSQALRSLGLSKREAEVLTLLAEGMRNAGIADRLFLSPHTVGKHLEHIYEKLGVHSRTEAVARAHRAWAGEEPDARPEAHPSPDQSSWPSPPDMTMGTLDELSGPGTRKFIRR